MANNGNFEIQLNVGFESQTNIESKLTVLVNKLNGISNKQIQLDIGFKNTDFSKQLDQLNSLVQKSSEGFKNAFNIDTGKLQQAIGLLERTKNITGLTAGTHNANVFGNGTTENLIRQETEVKKLVEAYEAMGYKVSIISKNAFSDNGKNLVSDAELNKLKTVTLELEKQDGILHKMTYSRPTVSANGTETPFTLTSLKSTDNSAELIKAQQKALADQEKAQQKLAQEVEKAKQSQQKLADAMAKGREKSELNQIKVEKQEELAKAKAINKSIEDRKILEENYNNWWLKTLKDRELAEQKSNEKLANQMANAREKSESSRNISDKKSEISQAQAINKALDDGYKQKIAEEQAYQKEIEKTITLMTKRVDGFAKNNILPDSDVNSLRNGISNLSVKSDANEFARISQLLDEATAKENEWKNAINNTQENIKKARSEQEARNKAQADGIINAEKERQTQQNLSDTANQYAQKTSIALDNLKTKYGSSVPTKELDELRTKLQSISSLSVNGKSIQSMEQLKAVIRETQLEYAKLDSVTRSNAGSFFGNLSHNIEQFMQFYVGAGGIIAVINSVREGISAVNELNTAITTINMTMDMSGDDMQKLTSTSQQLAKEMGISISEVLNAVKFAA